MDDEKCNTNVRKLPGSASQQIIKKRDVNDKDGGNLESCSKKLYLDGPGEFADVSKDIVQYIQTYLANITQLKALVKTPESGHNGTYRHITQFDIAPTGRGLNEILKIFDECVIPSGVQTTSGGDLSCIPNGGLPMAAFGDFIAASTNKYSGVFSVCPSAVFLEKKVLDWCAKLFGFDAETFGGNLCSGASIGTVMCVAAARDAHEIKASDYEKNVLYVSEGGHFCLDKAVNLVGMRESVVRKIPMDFEYKMDATVLEENLIDDVRNGLRPFFIVGTIGSTPTGAVDDISQLSSIAQKYGCWFHVDAAYGGFFILLPELKHKFSGIENADSICADPHKSLFIPFGSGVVLVRNRQHLLHTFSYQTTYLPPNRGIHSPAELSPELTRNFRGLRMWFPLMYHGVDAFVGALREKVALAKHAYNKMKTMKFIDVGPEPALTLFVFRYNGVDTHSENEGRHDIANGLNEEMKRVFDDDGRVYLSTTIMNGRLWFRVCVLGIRTHQKNIDTLLSMVESHYRQRFQHRL